jgi:hypothetical protein
MSESLIREIANEVLRDGLAQNWWTYAVLVALVAVSGVVSAFVTTYLRKRAETFATKADFEELLLQVRASTEASESVKSAIAKSDWAEREWRTLRRTKLEELMTAMHQATHWLDKEMDARFFDEPMPTDLSPIWKVEVLSTLYFPEIQSESNAFGLEFSKYRSWVVNVHADLLAAQQDAVHRRLVFNKRLPEMKEMRPKVLASAQLLTQSASKLMREVTGV